MSHHQQGLYFQGVSRGEQIRKVANYRQLSEAIHLGDQGFAS